ncbi:MAG: DUF5117 domain-containing protein [bacterium]|nr:DUF5117 domain-containing protein [bacterium]
MIRFSHLLPLVILGGCSILDSSSDSTPASESSDESGFEARIAGLEHRAGLFDVYVDQGAAEIFLALPAAGDDGLLAECLYIEGLATGLGSNPVGLDRGKIGGTKLLRMRRLGERVFFEEPNLAFRALDAGPDERRATEQSFATSIVWATDVLATDAEGRVLVDVTPFVVRDAHGVAGTLRSSGQGSFSLDKERSTLDPGGCLAFPDNIELEAILTFSGSEPGRHVRATAPDGSAVTLVQHHSFVRLPSGGYEPRPFDPRSGAFSIGFQDYASGLDEPLEVRWAVRHRLEKVDPRAPRSRAKEPIVYYVDRGAPEPVRSALVEGASWWAQAFEAAGYEDAFRVELLPEGVHPLDVRYNVIQWVHRSTRGWSYGRAVSDPRTGEIVKGHVSLGSLRVRQDRLLFEGLAGVERTGTGAADDPIQIALARIRQLSAHEVGHTLGFAHNFSASTNDRASVMDYPAPLVDVDSSGGLDFSEAYAVGIGAWDKVAVRWLYSDVPSERDTARELEEILAGAARDGLRYHTDADARASGAAHPYANLWDNGADPVEGLAQALRVRGHALARFGTGNLHAGRPLARLHEVFVPVYFHYRYQLDAAVKMIGGATYDYTVNGSGEPSALAPVLAVDQQRALIAVLDFLRAENLDVPESVLGGLLPRPPGHGSNRELFEGRTGRVFDALGLAATAAGQALAGLLHPERCERLVDQHRRDAGTLSFTEVLEGVCGAVFPPAALSDPRLAAIQREVQAVCARELLRLASSSSASAAVRGAVEARLAALLVEMGPDGSESREDAAHLALLAAEIRRFLAREAGVDTPDAAPAPAPPGSPIGLEACSHSFEPVWP